MLIRTRYVGTRQGNYLHANMSHFPKPLCQAFHFTSFALSILVTLSADISSWHHFLFNLDAYSLSDALEFSTYSPILLQGRQTASMSSESLDFDEVPLALPDLSHYMELPSYEKSIFTTDEQMAHNDATSYHTTLGDYDFPMSEVSSVLSEPPAKTGLDYEMAPNEDSGVAIDFSGTITPSPWPYGKPIRRSPWQPALSVRDMDDISSVSDSDSDGAEEQFAYEHSDEDDDHMSEQDNSGRLEDFDKIKVDSAVSDFEKLPCEVLSRIACLLPSDVHLTCLILTCHTFARQLQPENSGVWKTRFLQKFDHPIVEGPYEFRIAYQLRAIALPRFADLGFETRDKAKILLLILKDMVLETYHKPQQWHTTPRTSLNIIVFADAMKSNWMVHFLSTRLFARDHKHPYGRQPPNRLFDTLQVVFSYLVLNRSAMAFQVGSDKTDYDLARIYNWDQPFVLLYERLPDLAPESTPPPQSSLFPNLRRETPSPKWRFKLNMNTLLHIRNFWHRHLTEARAMGGEETFVNTAAELAEVGIVPRAWNCPLQEPTPLQTQWYGLYSCLYPWPRCRRQLEDKESEAEVWDSVDPLVSCPQLILISKLTIPASRHLLRPRTGHRLATNVLPHPRSGQNPHSELPVNRLSPRPRPLPAPQPPQISYIPPPTPS